MTSNNKYLTNLFFNTFIFLITFLIFIIRVLLQSGQKKKQKNSCFRKCRWREKSSPRRPQIHFFQSIFRRCSLFFFGFFCFLLLLFFFVCLFVAFWNWKCIFWYTFDCPGGWVIKRFSPGRFPETRLFSFWAHPAIYSIACTYLETVEYQNAPAVLKLPIMLPTCVRAHAFIVFVIKDFTQLDWFIFLAKKIIKENVETFLTVLMNFFHLKMSPENWLELYAHAQ